MSVFQQLSVPRRLFGLFLAGCLLLGGTAVGAAESAEDREFNAALALFNDLHFGAAERAFAGFVANHPGAATRPDAVLYQARSRLNQSNIAGGLDLLAREEANAGAIADRYRFFLGEGFFASGRFREAAQAFATLRRDFPNSAFIRESYVRQAMALAESGEWVGVSELLLEPGGFPKEADRLPDLTVVVLGRLLAAEAEIRNGRAPSALALLEKIAPDGLKSDLRWKRQFLLAQAQIAVGAAAAPVELAAGLVESARDLRLGEALAESKLFLGSVLERAGRPREAAAVWEELLASGAGPAEPRRSALSAVVRMFLERGDLVAALERLASFQRGSTNDPAFSAALLTTAEIQVRQAVAAATTNAALAASFRGSAVSNLQAVLALPGPPALMGRAWLQLGWVHWLEERFAEARSAFGKAVDLLPRSDDAVVAAFKTGDCELALDHPQAALDIYRGVAEQLVAGRGQVPGLFDELEYQRARAALKAGNLSEAEQAVTRLAAAFPTSDLSARAAVQLGVGFSRNDRIGDARRLMEDFVAKNPDSPYRDQAELIMARCLDRENRWSEASLAYDQWIARHPESALRPRVEYLRADATYRAGNTEGALAFFTHLAATRKEAEESILAENWLATYHWNAGAYGDAQKHYQFLYSRSNCPPELAFQARMMAGRAAYASSEFKVAREQFTALIESSPPATNPPPALAEVYWALGDTIVGQIRATPGSATPGEAISAFRWITTKFPGTAIAAAASGRLGELHLDQAGPNGETGALNEAELALNQAISSTNASRATLQLATIRLGQVRELQKKPEEALSLYLRVVYAPDEAAVDPFYVKEAGLKAALLLNSGSRWEQLVNLYDRLIRLMPALRPALAPRQDDARRRLSQGQG